MPCWLQDINGRAVLPGLIIRCSRETADYVPPPSPVELTEVLALSRQSKGKSSLSPFTPLRKGTKKLRNNSPASPSRVTGVLRRLQTPPRRSERADPLQGSPNPASSLRRGVSPSSPTPPQQRGGQLSYEERKISPAHAVATSPIGRSGVDTPVGTPSGGRGGKKGRGQVAFEAASAAMKAKFKAQASDCMIMVVTINGYLSQPPRTARSLEGYCAMVSLRTL